MGGEGEEDEMEVTPDSWEEREEEKAMEEEMGEEEQLQEQPEEIDAPMEGDDGGEEEDKVNSLLTPRALRGSWRARWIPRRRRSW